MEAPLSLPDTYKHNFFVLCWSIFIFQAIYRNDLLWLDYLKFNRNAIINLSMLTHTKINSTLVDMQSHLV